jgi:hypothetical protein
MHWLTLLLSVALLGAVAYRAQQKKTSKAKVIEFPGPYQLPFIGRIHDLPIQYMVSLIFKQSRVKSYMPRVCYLVILLTSSTVVEVL